MPFDPIHEPADYILLAQRRSPGIAEVTNVNSPRRYDERRAYGMSGATTVYRGAALVHPIVRLHLTTEQDWTDWDEWKELVLREQPADAADVNRSVRRIEAARREESELVQQIGTDPRVVERDPAITERLASAGRRARQPVPGTALRRPRALDIWHPILEDWGVHAVNVEDCTQPTQSGDGEWTIDIKFIEYREPVFALARPQGSTASEPLDRFDRRIQQEDAANQALADAGGIIR